MNAKLFTSLQYGLPQHTLSRVVGWLANCQQPWLKNIFIRWFVQRYHVDMQDAVEINPENYGDFNSFFIRQLKPETRPVVDDPHSLACPVDGAVSQLGSITQQQIFQAKGHDYQLIDLLGGNAELAQLFADGTFATLYLAPANYHRIHMPIDGKLTAMWHVPGRLFSVNTITTENIPNLFARNERVICLFATAAGPMLMILVGAMIVASINTVWAGAITPKQPAQTLSHWDYQHERISLARGAEMGYFKLGSTVITLFTKDRIKWVENLHPASPLRMGQLLATLIE